MTKKPEGGQDSTKQTTTKENTTSSPHSTPREHIELQFDASHGGSIKRINQHCDELNESFCNPGKNQGELIIPSFKPETEMG